MLCLSFLLCKMNSVRTPSTRLAMRIKIANIYGEQRRGQGTPFNSCETLLKQMKDDLTTLFPQTHRKQVRSQLTCTFVVEFPPQPQSLIQGLQRAGTFCSLLGLRRVRRSGVLEMCLLLFASEARGRLAPIEGLACDSPFPIPH